MKKIISKSIRKHVKTNDKDNRMVWNIIYVIHMYIVDLHFFTIFHHIFPRSFIFTMFRFWNMEFYFYTYVIVVA